ncbi:MAG TPA: hypothetical protein VGB94_02455 [Acidobacteriaceae bacterium]
MLSRPLWPYRILSLLGVAMAVSWEVILHFAHEHMAHFPNGSTHYTPEPFRTHLIFIYLVVISYGMFFQQKWAAINFAVCSFIICGVFLISAFMALPLSLFSLPYAVLAIAPGIISIRYWPKHQKSSI